MDATIIGANGRGWGTQEQRNSQTTPSEGADQVTQAEHGSGQ